MKFSIHQDIIDLLPARLCGVVVLTGINNKSASKEPYALLKQVMDEIQKKDIEAIDEIQEWNQAFETLRINPNKFPPSIVAMVKRLSKGNDLPSVNAVVDLYNTVTLKKMIPMGGYDLDKVTDDMEIRFTEPKDRFLPMGKKEAEEVSTGEAVFVSGHTVMASNFAWRQDDIHKVTENTTNVLLRVESLKGSKEELKETLDEVARLIQKYCGGEFKTYIVGADNPSVDLGVIEAAEAKPKTAKEIAIDELLNRGTVDVILRPELEEKLRSGKKLRIKLGIDPTGFDLHLGHMVVVKKLAEFQKLGHHILLLFGNFTGQIGDPTGKSDVRTQMKQEELENNAKNYLHQVSKVLDIENVEVVWNADWLAKLTFGDVVGLCSQFTVGQMLERDMFQDRIKNEKAIYVHEFMYPLMQGYDSVAIKADVELGGTDQTFNLLAGRTLQKAFKQKPQSVITVPILEGTDGKIKMGKSVGNYIGVMEDPKDQYGKIMSIPDELIFRYFELATDMPMDEIDDMRTQVSEGMNPRDAKMMLAREIVTLYHSKEEAAAAQDHFINIFQKKSVPDDMPEAKVAKGTGILDIMVQNEMVGSSSEARRMITQGAVSFNDEKVESIDFEVSKKGVLKVGKRRFLKVSC